MVKAKPQESPAFMPDVVTGWVMKSDGFWWYGNGDIEPKLMFPSQPWPKRHKPKAGEQLKLF